MSISVRLMADLIEIRGNIPSKSEGAVYAPGDLVSNGVIVLSAVFNSYIGFAEVVSAEVFELKDGGDFQGGDGRLIIFNNPDVQLTDNTSNEVFALASNHVYSDILQMPFVDGDWKAIDDLNQMNRLDLSRTKGKNIIQVKDSTKYDLGLGWITDAAITYPDDNNEIYFRLFIKKHYGISPNG